MPVVFIAPDEKKSSSRFPTMKIQQVLCPGLEERTGSDFFVSSLPSYSSPNGELIKERVFDDQVLRGCLKKGYLFLQRKSGTDFKPDSLKRAIARAQKCGIELGLLQIGTYKEGSHGELLINGKSFGNMTWDTYQTILAKWQKRGGILLPILERESQLEAWIKVRAKVITETKAVEMLPKVTKPIEGDNILNVSEIPPDDWRYFLCAGLRSLGIIRVNHIRDYCLRRFKWATLHHALMVMSQANEDGSPAHPNIPKWGRKSFDDFRNLLGLAEGYNLFISDMSEDSDPIALFIKGVQMTTEIVRAKHGENPKKDGLEILEIADREIIEFLPILDGKDEKRDEATDLKNIQELGQKIIIDSKGNGDQARKARELYFEHYGRKTLDEIAALAMEEK